MDTPRADRLRELLDSIVRALDEDLDGSSLAARNYLSRFHFDRMVAAGLGEPPGAFRRRLLLERAAWRLGRGMAVTEAGWEAGYGSTEAFSRAFSRAYDTAPSRFGEGKGDFRIAAPNGVHFHPPAGLRVPGEKEAPSMGLTERLIEHDHWLTGRLIERAAGLPDEALDREIRPGHVVLDFDGPEPSVRAMIDRLVWTKEVWTAAIAGHDMPAGGDRSLPGLRARWDRAGAEFVGLARRIGERGEWNESFVDALCEPPQSFTFGGVLAHVITFSAHRRQVLIDALRELGVEGVEAACPMEWELQRAAERSHSAEKLRGAP